MKAAFIEHPGPAAEIRYGDLPRPTLRENEVLVRARAVAVNHVDTYIRSGAFPVQMPLPFIVGRDMVGTVCEIGSAVETFQIGDTVWTNSMGHEGRQGTFAEYVAVPAERLYPLPPNINPVEAVAVLHAALTATIGLFEKAQLRAGDALFINGGSGNIGLAILQIARACGARVAVTAGNPAKAEWCRKMGADCVVNYHTENITEAIAAFAPAGLDIFWEATARFDLERVLPQMADGGRFIVIAGRERRCEFPLWPFYTKNCTLHGFVVTGTGVERLQSYARQINAWLENGTLRAKLHAVLPLSQAAEAHRLQEAGRLAGKIVLTPEK